MRVGLAALIVIWHTVITSYGIDAQRALALGVSRPFWALLLPMFFALSGFLVSGSLERSPTLISFLGLRLIRLFPALAVESLIAMLIIGPIFTVYTLREYFSDPILFRYTLNIVGIVQYFLPGVFINNPVDRVNAQLWTLPFELKCYIAISLFYMFRFYRIVILFVTGCVMLQAALAIWIYTHPLIDEGTVRGPVLVMAFLFGSLLYRIRDHVPWNGALFAASMAISVVLLCFPLTSALSPLPVAYATVYLGLLDPARSRAVSSGDYSYGIFLYGFPIQQAVAAALPEARTWYMNLICSAPLIALVAYASWHYVEKKALVLRGPLKRFELWCLPVHARIVAIYDHAVAAGLRSRWAPKRLRQPEP